MSLETSRLLQPPSTYGCSGLGAEHLAVLAVLAFQGVDVALHPEHHVCHGPLPR